MDSVIVRTLVIRGLIYGLKMLRVYMSKPDFKKTVDEVLDRVENHFREGSLPDEIAELICSEVRAYFNVPDED